MAISLKFTRFTVKGNLLLVKGLSKFWRVRSINIWLRFPKNVYNNKLDEIVNKYSNTNSTTIKIKPADLQSGMYTDKGVEHSKNF